MNPFVYGPYILLQNSHTMLAFLVDQMEQLCDVLFQDALEKMGRLKYLREKVRWMFQEYILESWALMYTAIAIGYKARIDVDTS